MSPKRIALTPGEPAGIGPDLAIQLAQRGSSDELVVIADVDLMLERARLLGLPLRLREYQKQEVAQPLSPGELVIYSVPMPAPCKAGQLTVENAPYVLETLRIAVEGCMAGDFAALTTAPVQKSIINDAGIAFTGHTEFLAELCQTQVVMMLATEQLKVALVTTHLPLRDVAKAITKTLLQEVITILHRDLQTKFALSQPKILVAGLNPHAGEGGHLGKEEIEIIEPVIQQLRRQGLHLTGPLPADTLFTDKYLQSADAVLTMYHDQGLPVLKYQGFGRAVNLTLGLPFIRSSVDHGTALELAGSGKSHLGSLLVALRYASELAGCSGS